MKILVFTNMDILHSISSSLKAGGHTKSKLKIVKNHMEATRQMYRAMQTLRPALEKYN